MTTAFPDIGLFYGTMEYHKSNLGLIYTDGVKYVVETAKAHWLLDKIAILQIIPRIAEEPFQVFTLKVNPDQSAILTCDDGNDNVVDTEEVPWTDFPEEGIKFFYTNAVLMLPLEY